MHRVSGAALLPSLSMEGVKSWSALALWVLSVLGSSYLHLMWHRSRIQSSQWRGGGGRRVNYFPRDLSQWISPWLLSLGLQLWQISQEEGQTLNSRKSEDPDSFPCPLRELLRGEKWQWILKGLVFFANAASLLFWSTRTPGSSSIASQFSRRKWNMQHILCPLLHLQSYSH